MDALGFGERLLTRFHLFRCRHCRAYADQLRAIGRLARTMFRDDPASEASISRLEKAILADLTGTLPDPDAPSGP